MKALATFVKVVKQAFLMQFEQRCVSKYMVTRRVNYADGTQGTATFYFRTRNEAVKVATSFKAKQGRSSVSVVHQCFYTITNNCPLPTGLFTAYN